MKWTKQEQAEAIETLRREIHPGDTVYTMLKHVSRSGMLRVIMPMLLKDDGPRYLGWSVAAACDDSYDRQREGIKVTGCGMDMGFALVYDLSYKLWPDGFGCIGEGCPSNDHSSGSQDYTPYMPVQERIGADGMECRCHSSTNWHKDGGYAVRHRWI